MLSTSSQQVGSGDQLAASILRTTKQQRACKQIRVL
jgi:hypothetical protein